MDIGKPYIAASLFSALLLSLLTLTDITPVTAAVTDALPDSRSHAPQLNPQDHSFAVLFANAGLAEQELGRLADRRSRRPDVRKLARMLTDDHQRMHARLTAMLAPMRLAPLPDQPDAEDKALAHQLQQADRSDFDRLYADARVRDHEDLISVLEMEASSGERPELRQFASDTLVLERRHLEEARRVAAELKRIR